MIWWCKTTNFVLYLNVIGLFVTFTMCGAMAVPPSPNHFQMSDLPELSKSHPLLASLYNTAETVKQVEATHGSFQNLSGIQHLRKGLALHEAQSTVDSSQLKESFRIKGLIEFPDKLARKEDQHIPIRPNTVSTLTDIMCSLCGESDDVSVQSDCSLKWCSNTDYRLTSRNEINPKIIPIFSGFQQNVNDAVGKGNSKAITPQTPDAVGILPVLPVDVSSPPVDLFTTSSSVGTKLQTPDANIHRIPLDVSIPVTIVDGEITKGFVKPGMIGKVNLAGHVDHTNTRKVSEIGTPLMNDALEAHGKAGTSIGDIESLTPDIAKSTVDNGRIVDLHVPVPELNSDALATLMSHLMTDNGTNDNLPNVSSDRLEIHRNPRTNTPVAPFTVKDAHAADVNGDSVGNILSIGQELNTSGFHEQTNTHATIERIPKRHIEISSARFPFGEGPTRPPIVVQTTAAAPTIQTMNPVRKQELRQLSNVLMEQVKP